MFSTIVLVILAIIFVGLIAAAFIVDDFPLAFALVPLVLLVVVGFLSMFTTVEAKNVGVLTSWGKTSDDTLGAGPHLKAPWAKNTQLDGTVQTDEYRGDGCITVLLEDKNTACISATNRWQIVDAEADTIYGEYRSDDPTKSLRDAVVSTEFKSAVFDAFGDYDPTLEGAIDTKAVATEVKAALLEASGGLIDVERVTISYVKLGEKAQAKIDALEGQKAATRIATEKIQTANKEAEANRVLSDSVSNDPNVLVSKCFDLIADGLLTLPAGSSCWPGSGGGVVIPSAGAK